MSDKSPLVDVGHVTMPNDQDCYMAEVVVVEVESQLPYFNTEALKLKARLKGHMGVYAMCGFVTIMTWIYLTMTAIDRPFDVWSVVSHLYSYNISMTVSLFILSSLTWIWGLIVYVSIDEWIPPSRELRQGCDVHASRDDDEHHVTVVGSRSAVTSPFQRSLLGYCVFLTGFVYMLITIDCMRVLLRNYASNINLYSAEYVIALVFFPVTACFMQSVLTSTYLYYFIVTTPEDVPCCHANSDNKGNITKESISCDPGDGLKAYLFSETL